MKTSRTISYSLALFLAAALVSCKKTPPIDNTMLDGNEVSDPSISHPERYLVSYANEVPAGQREQKPVIIVAHGYSATTYEWDEFRKWSDTNTTYLTSQVLLGGHGRNYETFKRSTWRDWQKPIIDEYLRLDSMGFRNISVAGSSTAGPLILDLLYNNSFPRGNLPRNVIFIDPIVIPSNKSLSLIDYVGPAIGYVRTDLDPAEVGHFYTFRPQESLNELMDIINITRDRLEKGITVPRSVRFTVYKSKKDPSADPYSAVIIYRGVSMSDGSKITVHMEDSKLHVITYLQGRKTYTSADRALQLKVFGEINDLITK